MCDFIAKALTETGTVMIRLAVQQWTLWETGLKKAHLVMMCSCYSMFVYS